MKRGDTDLSEVVTALLSVHFSPLCPSFSLIFCNIFTLSCIFLLSFSLLYLLVSCLSLLFFFLFAGNELPDITIYLDDLFSCLSEENDSAHACLHTLVLVCAHTVYVYFHCHPQLMAHPSPHPATQGGRKAMVQSRPMAASMVWWSRLSV